jgi:hypothetical protein
MSFSFPVRDAGFPDSDAVNPVPDSHRGIALSSLERLGPKGYMVVTFGLTEAHRLAWQPLQRVVDEISDRASRNSAVATRKKRKNQSLLL